jgi:hypothetical protein
MDCFACMSLWVAAPIAVATARRPGHAPLQWLALSAAACLLERASSSVGSALSEP